MGDKPEEVRILEESGASARIEVAAVPAQHSGCTPQPIRFTPRLTRRRRRRAASPLPGAGGRRTRAGHYYSRAAASSSAGPALHRDLSSSSHTIRRVWAMSPGAYEGAPAVRVCEGASRFGRAVAGAAAGPASSGRGTAGASPPSSWRRRGFSVGKEVTQQCPAAELRRAKLTNEHALVRGQVETRAASMAWTRVPRHAARRESPPESRPAPSSRFTRRRAAGAMSRRHVHAWP